MGYIEYIGKYIFCLFFKKKNQKSEIEKYEKAVALENKGKEITKEDFEKKIKEEEKIFFSTKLEEAKENAKIKSLENQKLLQEGKIDQKELISREKINQGVIDFFEKKNKIIEHDIWILNKNKYDLRRYPIYS